MCEGQPIGKELYSMGGKLSKLSVSYYVLIKKCYAFFVPPSHTN
jgi:hypothetical protein